MTLNFSMHVILAALLLLLAGCSSPNVAQIPETLYPMEAENCPIHRERLTGTIALTSVQPNGQPRTSEYKFCTKCHAKQSKAKRRQN